MRSEQQLSAVIYLVFMEASVPGGRYQGQGNIVKTCRLQRLETLEMEEEESWDHH